MIGPTAEVALLVLFLVGILSMLLEILIRAIAIARFRGCGWWLMGAFWGTLFQVAVAPVQWAMAKGHTIGKMATYQMIAEAARLEMEDAEVQRLTIEELDWPSAPRMQLNILDRLVNWSNEFLGRRDTEQIYPAPVDRNVQAVLLLFLDPGSEIQAPGWGKIRIQVPQHWKNVQEGSGSVINWPPGSGFADQDSGSGSAD